MNKTTAFTSYKNRCKNRAYRSPASIPEYLHRLGLRLLWHYPMAQVFDILTDYQEYLTAEKEQEADPDRLFQKFGSPEAVTKELLTENRSEKPYPYLMPFLWSALLLLFLWEAMHQDGLSPVLLCLACFALFGLIRGREHMAIARRFPAGQFPASRIILTHMLVIVMIAVKEGIMRYACAHAENLPVKIFHMYTDRLINALFSLFVLSLLLTAGVMLVKSAFSSIRHFPAAVHAAGAAVSTAKTLQTLKSMDLNQTAHEILFYPLICYGTALVIALCFTVLLRPGKPEKHYTQRGACHGCTD